MKLRRVAVPVVLGVLLAVAAFVATTTATGSAGSQVKAPPDMAARGRYLAAAADCAACHTAPGGAPYAGGLAMQSGFGTIYATNITPDPEYGIGRWTAADFWRALHDGIARGGRHLYPAMPYTSYRGMTRADSDAIYAYVMQLHAARVPNRKTNLSFPYNIRLGMVAWNALFLTDHIPSASSGSSQAWWRGRYLVDVLGHCGECHTPRGWLGQMKLSRPMAGFALGRFAAPDVTPAGLAARGWTGKALATFLATGLAPQGWAFGNMYPVIVLSTQHLKGADLKAVATYLLGDHPPVPAPLPGAAADTEGGAGRAAYVAVCAGCHGLDGSGEPDTVVAMRDNSVLRLSDPRNLIQAILHGITAQNFPDQESMQAMPGFADKLSDAQAADLANYLRATWGGRKPDVTPAIVQSLR